MFDKVKLALRVTTDAFDAEIQDLINAALADLGIAGVVDSMTNESSGDALVLRAVTTYCKLHFGEPTEKDYDRLKASYDEQKAQLATSTPYTDWTAVYNA